MPADVARPLTSEAAENRRSPAMNRRCVPNRSAARPPSSRKPPKTSVYALTTHWRPVGEKCRPRSMLGRATFTIVASRITMNWATQTSNRMSQRFVVVAVIGRDLLRVFSRYPSKRHLQTCLFPRVGCTGSMPTYICVTCGTQFAPGAEPPPDCPICLDERQYVGPGGQQWTTSEEFREAHHSRVEEIEPALIGVGVEPSFAIGQRALHVESLLWDCVPLVDDDAVDGVETIAISHPHYYTTMVDWAERFD